MPPQKNIINLEKKFKKISWIGLTVFVLLTAFLGYHLKDIRFDYNFENFFQIDTIKFELNLSFKKYFVILITDKLQDYIRFT